MEMLWGPSATLGGPNRLFLLQGDQFTLFDLPGLLPITQDNGGMQFAR